MRLRGRPGKESGLVRDRDLTPIGVSDRDDVEAGQGRSHKLEVPFSVKWPGMAHGPHLPSFLRKQESIPPRHPAGTVGLSQSVSRFVVGLVCTPPTPMDSCFRRNDEVGWPVPQTARAVDGVGDRATQAVARCERLVRHDAHLGAYLVRRCYPPWRLFWHRGGGDATGLPLASTNFDARRKRSRSRFGVRRQGRPHSMSRISSSFVTMTATASP